MNPNRLSNIASIAFTCTICIAAAAMPQTATKPATTNPAASAEEPPKITVLKPGDAPRSALRFHVTKGSTATMEMVMRMSMKMTMDQMQMPDQALPPMRFIMRMSVTDVKDNGDFAYEFATTDAGTLDEAGADPQMVAMLKAQLKPIIGLKGHGEMTSRGILKSADLDIPPNMPPMAKQQIESLRKSMHQMVMPLPEEPVGPGGQWKVDQKLTAGGIKLEQVFEVTLKSVQGDKVEMSLQVTQSADPQDVTMPELPEGATAHLASLSSKGEGKVSMDLVHPLNPRNQVDTTSDVAMSITMQGQNHQMDQHLEINVTWQEAKPTESKPATTQPATRPGGNR